MDPYLGYEIFVLVLAAYAGVVYLLWRSGRIGPDRSLSLLGPALMLKTTRGRNALDRWGRFTRFWTPIADVGIALAALAMVVIVAVLVFGAIVAVRLSAAQAPTAQEAVGLPGINPVIPLGYGIVAIVLGIVLHEVLHGVIARSQKIGVKSLGVLWFIVPIGAFVEQDDQEMLAAPRRKRDRVAAAGVLANFVLATVFFFALSGLVASSVQPNASGVGVAYVEANTPAANATIGAGDIIMAVNGTSTSTVALFETALAKTTPGETVNVTFFSSPAGHPVTASVPLGTNPSNRTRGFLGVGVLAITPTDLKQTLIWPESNSAGPVAGVVVWITLPLATLEPVGGSTAAFYHLSGPLAPVGSTTFWVGANLLYWLAWMNLLLGLSNCLPLVPLDGGLLFRDFVASVAARFRSGWTAARLDEFGGRAAVLSSVAVLLLLAWQFIIPRVH